MNINSSVDTPLVSVIVLTYNHKDYLEQNLNGILMQKTSFPFKIYVHDDASTDGTRDIILKYYEKYPGIIVPILQSENQYSKGIRPYSTFVYPKLNSKYVGFCEGDDYWTDPDKLRIQIEYLEQNPGCSICCHDVNIVHEGIESPREVFYNIPHKSDFRFDFLSEFTDHFVPTPTIVTRLDILREQPANYTTLVSGDIQKILFLLSRGYGYYFSKKMVTKRRNPGGITSNMEYRKIEFEGRYEVLYYIINFAPDTAVSAIRKKMAEYERAFIKLRLPVKRHNFLMLIFNAVWHDPGWFFRRRTNLIAVNTILFPGAPH